MCSNILLNGKLNETISPSEFLNLVISKNTSKIITLLILGRVNINVRDCSGKNALYWAMLNEDYELMKALIKYKIDLKVSKNLNALNFAVYLDNPKLLKTLCDCGLDIDCYDEINSTPLIYAILYNKKRAINFLILKGANQEHEDFMGNCPKNLLKRA